MEIHIGCNINLSRLLEIGNKFVVLDSTKRAFSSKVITIINEQGTSYTFINKK